MKAFVTGSRKYGTPSEASDIDLVIRIDGKDLELLCRAADNAVNQYETTRSVSLRFGVLNIIAVLKDADYDAWDTATKALEMKKPVTRDIAVTLIKALLGTAKENDAVVSEEAKEKQEPVSA